MSNKQPYHQPLLTPHNLARAIAAKAAGECALLLVCSEGAAAGVELSITRAGTNVVVSWPAPTNNLVLQGSTNLATGWASVASQAVTNSQTVSVTVPIAGGRQFFRLNTNSSGKTGDKDPSEKDPSEKTSDKTTDKDPSEKTTDKDPSEKTTDKDPSEKTTDKDPSEKTTDKDPLTDKDPGEKPKETEKDPISDKDPLTDKDPTEKSQEGGASIWSIPNDPYSWLTEGACVLPKRRGGNTAPYLENGGRFGQQPNKGARQ